MINKVIEEGRITKDLELRQSPSGTSVIKFTLAVNRRFKTEGQQSVDYIPCVAWGKTAELINNNLHKGSLISIVGRLESGSYKDKEDRTVYTLDALVEEVHFLDTRSGKAKQPSNVVEDYADDTLDIQSDELPW